ATWYQVLLTAGMLVLMVESVPALSVPQQDILAFVPSPTVPKPQSGLLAWASSAVTHVLRARFVVTTAVGRTHPWTVRPAVVGKTKVGELAVVSNDAESMAE